ncbi:hypothetical protein BG011_007588 [Mortierella polycephala]|uniref:Uncharacterized protein n=1 Tax=Mortierella polycephala TaxID=41804 RepID=A0A9P6TY01_9FUNG|nr:hypothetical protein BG011_007588 [Mortierella polycephala]
MKKIYGNTSSAPPSIYDAAADAAWDSLEDERRNPFFTIDYQENLNDSLGVMHPIQHRPRGLGLLWGPQEDENYVQMGGRQVPNGEILLVNKTTCKSRFMDGNIGQSSFTGESGFNIAVDLTARSETRSSDAITFETCANVNSNNNATATASSVHASDDPSLDSLRTLIDPHELTQTQQKRSRMIGTYILEFGVAMHSIVIGITLGATVNCPDFISFLIALLFYRFFEGVALGGRIAALGFA